MDNNLPVRFTVAKAPKVFKDEQMGFELVSYPYSDELWFNADLICKDLGYKHTMQTLKTVFREHIDEYVKYYSDMKYTRATSYIPYVTRIGLQYLVLASHKEAAWPFKKWVVEEVLKSIYTNGGYIMGQEKLSEDERNKLITEIKSLHNQLDNARKALGMTGESKKREAMELRTLSMQLKAQADKKDKEGDNLLSSMNEIPNTDVMF